MICAQIEDRNGNLTTLTYGGGLLTKVTDTYGRSLLFAYNLQRRLASVVSATGYRRTRGTITPDPVAGRRRTASSI